MKNVIVNCNLYTNTPYILLENESDVLSYMEEQEELTQQDLISFIKSNGKTEDKISDMAEDCNSSIFKTAANLSKINGKNPIYLLASQYSNKMLAMLRLLEVSDGILINSVGGYRDYQKDIHTIVSEKPLLNKKDEYITINQNTQYINLENDPFLEKHTISTLSEKDENFSYICNLRSFSIEELTTIFTYFINAGGHTVYVYTTASDIQQMFDYAKAIVNSGLKNVIIEFSCSIPFSNVDDIVSYLRNKNVSVNLVYYKDKF